jgi:hypothetical protein
MRLQTHRKGIRTPVLGEEQVENGTFDVDASWVKNNGSTIAGGVGNVIALGPLQNTGNNHVLYQNAIVPLDGQRYYLRIVYEARQTVGTNTFQSGMSFNIVHQEVISSTFKKYQFDIPHGTESSTLWRYVFGGVTSGDQFEVDNVSIKYIIRL